jgi:hypothetical protein
MLGSGTRLLQGTIFCAVMMMAPAAFAHGDDAGYRHDSDYSREDSYYQRDFDSRDSGYSERHSSRSHHHRHFARHQRHHERVAFRHRDRMMARAEGARLWHEHAPGERHRDRGRDYSADYAIERRRIADAREEPVTVDLNLDQLRRIRERNAAIARWEEEFGTSRG